MKKRKREKGDGRQEVKNKKYSHVFGSPSSCLRSPFSILRILIRSDASTGLGSGHVMRCLTLADELSKSGAKIEFICREETGNLIEDVAEKGYTVHRFSAGIDINTDCMLTRNFLEKQTRKPDWLIIDHYEIDASWESPLRELVKKIMVIDDLANRYHDCDILLDQNISVKENRYNGFVPPHSLKLLGPEYALLRQEFAQARMRLKEKRDKVKRILVTMGGGDPKNQTVKVLKGIKMLDRNDISIDVIIGALNPNKTEIEEMVSEMLNVKCFSGVNNMSDFMLKADIAIGASGSTTWERCCLGLPSIVMVLADNQKDIAETLDKMGVIKNLGWYENVSEKDIKIALQEILDNLETRKIMSEKSLKVVDGKGVERIVRRIFKK